MSLEDTIIALNLCCNKIEVPWRFLAGTDHEDSGNKTMQETSGYNFSFRIFALCFGSVPEGVSADVDLAY